VISHGELEETSSESVRIRAYKKEHCRRHRTKNDFTRRSKEAVGAKVFPVIVCVVVTLRE
jgi:hypothetical protein